MTQPFAAAGLEPYNCGQWAAMLVNTYAASFFIARQRNVRVWPHGFTPARLRTFVVGVAVMRLMQAAMVAAVAAVVPTVEIAPGVHMPMVSLGARQASSQHAQPLPTASPHRPVSNHCM